MLFGAIFVKNKIENCKDSPHFYFTQSKAKINSDFLFKLQKLDQTSRSIRLVQYLSFID